MPNIGPMEIVGLLLLALLLFGAKRLPEIGRSLGTGMREFKDSVSGDKKAVETRSELPPPAPGASASAVTAEDTTAAPPPPEPRETEPVS
jgi:TatA/E family protein of Tat protein translocase